MRNEGSNRDMELAELRGKIIEQDITVLQSNDEKQKLVQKMSDMKNRFNDIVKDKADLQRELIKSEEEKLKVSKALIDLQIENTRMNEKL